ncbi:hypothetical protein MRB53_014406 [Persea americana]|uniref:Uncharacterized protein n=1 Tax=Persea americana TaxID=3435 RepID=A0ACC2KAM8_PERAE|nr:hypothetical protein MRB53_014406 [Persea americana]
MGFSAASVVGEAVMAMWRCEMATVWSAWSEKLAMATVWSEERGDVFRFLSEERNLQGVGPADGAGAINKSGGTMAGSWR